MTDEPIQNQIRTDEEVLNTVAKLLKLAEKAGTPEEAAAAAAKAQALMVQYNLTESALEKQTGKRDGKRETALVEGGFYKFQRDLFDAVSRLNFCISWSETYIGTVERDRVNYHHIYKHETQSYRKGDPIRKRRFKIVGRVANVAATRVMFNYLSASITRILGERLRGSDGKIPKGAMAGGWATSFREGAADDLVRRIYDARRDAEKVRQKEAEAKAKEAGASSSTALTLADLEEREWAANYDEIAGEGAWARKMQRQAEAAEKRREREEMMTRLQAENPEEYRRLADEDRKKRRRESSGMGRKERERHVDPSAYRAGREAAKNISLNPQVSDVKPRELEHKK